MNWLANLTAGLKALFQKRHVDGELDEELDSYMEASVAHKKNLGMPMDVARRAALVEIGSRNSVKHRVWSSRWESIIDNLLQDLRVSLRTLARSPGFTAVALLSLALGIGCNTAIFTLVQQVLLRNLPVPDPQQLVTFGTSTGGGILGGVDLGAFDMFPWDFARQLETDPGPFEGIAAYGSFSPKVSVRVDGSATNSPASQIPASLVSGNYFKVLGSQPLIGRTILPSDDAAAGSGPVVVLSHHYWQQSLSGDAAILGKTLTINKTPFTIIGIMPEAFHGIKQELEPPDFWAPISMQPQILLSPSFLQPHSAYFLHLLARRDRQSTLANDQKWLDQQIRTGIRATEGATVSPEREQEINRATVRLVSAAHGVSALRSQYGDSLQILMAIVGLVLLIACANLANFLLARAASRQREIATRLALGSSRARIVHQSLIETLLLSVTGGLLGLGIAFVSTRALITFVAQDSTYTTLSPYPDTVVLLFTLGVSLLTGLLFGLAPALSAARTGAVSSLSSNSRTSQASGGRSSRFWPKVLVTAQVMLSLTLLVGAGLFVRTLRNLQSQDYGFERNHLLLAQFGPKLAGYKPSQLPSLHQQVIDRLESLPGVRSAALSETAPISFGTWNSTITIPGYTPAPKENMSSVLNRVSGHYFETTGIAILAGRSINPEDSATSLKVAVVNQTLAHNFFPKGDALGRALSINIDSVAGPWQIVGIARDTKSGNPRDSTSPMTYIPLAQIVPMTKGAQGMEENEDRFASTVLLRTAGDPAQAISELRGAVAAIDPNIPVLHIHTIQQHLDTFMSHEQLISRLTSLFSLLALVLASIGLYGVISYNVVSRTNEIGIRLALGSQTRTILWMVLRESLWLLVIGVALGIPLSIAASSVIKQQLYGLSASDPLTFVVAVLVVAAMTLFSAWLPARRATQVDPMTALRCD